MACEIGDSWLEAQAVGGLGATLMMMGRLEEARTHLELDLDITTGQNLRTERCDLWDSFIGPG